MDYGEVGRYSRVYDLQQEFMSAQSRAEEALMGVYGLVTLLGKDPKRISNSQLEQSERTLGVALANARTVESLGGVLKQEYTSVLEQH